MPFVAWSDWYAPRLAGTLVAKKRRVAWSAPSSLMGCVLLSVTVSICELFFVCELGKSTSNAEKHSYTADAGRCASSAGGE